jgi:streptomycin 6-kinase
MVVKLPFDCAPLAREHRALQLLERTGASVRPAHLGRRAIATHWAGESAGEPAEQAMLAMLERLHTAAAQTSDGLPSLTEDVRARLELARGRIDRVSAASPLTEEHIERATQLATQLGGGTSVVHGDMHAGNMIAGVEGLVMCDPKGAVGDNTYDAAMWSLKADGSRSHAWWLDALSELYERERLEAWAAIISVHEAMSYLWYSKSLRRVPTMTACALARLS